MRQETRTLYQFDELSESAKEKAREWYREASRYDSFNSDYVLFDFCAVAKHLGFDVSENEISFSGFYSQGDGASFSGQFCLSGYGCEIREHAPRDEHLNNIATEIKKAKRVFYGRLIRAIPCEYRADIRAMFTNPMACAYVVITKAFSRYAHDGCMRHDGGENILEDIRYRLGDSMEFCDESAIEQACEEFAENILDEAKDMAGWLYCALESEYEYQNSDEVIDENIIANEYEFDEDGEGV